MARFIDFFWEIQFEGLFKKYPEGFSDVLFPNIGYTYLINLGTPFIMQLEENKYEMKTDGFLPRHKKLACHHFAGNKIFGIKFKVSPVVFQKRINFSEYRDYIFPLAYLIDRNIVQKTKAANSFEKRVEIISAYYDEIVGQLAGSLDYVNVVTEVLDGYNHAKNFSASIEELAARYQISSRTLQRYFEASTSLSSKKALQIMRIRNAVEELTDDPSSFDYKNYGYYDYSHFYKHLKQFIGKEHFSLFQQQFL